MGWKKWPYWLKGGIIGIIIAIIAFLADYSSEFFRGLLVNQLIQETILIKVIMGLFTLILMTLGLPMMITQIAVCFPNDICPQHLIIDTIWLLIYTIIGVVMGFVYGRLKRKKL